MLTDLSIQETEQVLKAIIRVLKDRFPNLTTEESIDLGFKILQEVRLVKGQR